MDKSKAFRKCASPRRMWRICVAALATVAATQVAAQDSACDFFKGKTVELSVPFEAGGGFDIYARMVAKFMAGELGAAHMIVRNEPGAGGLLGTNQTWKAEPDGLRIQLAFTGGMITAELGGAAGVGFRSNEFSWIGRITGEPDVIVKAPESALRDADGLKELSAERKIRIGSTGVGAGNYIEARLIAEIFDLDADIITGFSGAPEVYTSLARNELDLFTASLSGVQVAKKAGTADYLFVFSDKGIADMPEIKPLSEVVDAQYLPLVKAHSDVIAGGRALAAPPGMTPERLQCLRDAFDRTMVSEGLQAESRQLNRPVEPLSGDEMAALVAGVTKDPLPEYMELLKSSFGN